MQIAKEHVEEKKHNLQIEELLYFM